MGRVAATPRRHGLEALRGLAAVSAIAYRFTSWYRHAIGGHPPPGVNLAFPHGDFGVELFWLLSR